MTYLGDLLTMYDFTMTRTDSKSRINYLAGYRTSSITYLTYYHVPIIFPWCDVLSISRIIPSLLILVSHSGIPVALSGSYEDLRETTILPSYVLRLGWLAS